MTNQSSRQAKARMLHGTSSRLSCHLEQKQDLSGFPCNRVGSNVLRASPDMKVDEGEVSAGKRYRRQIKMASVRWYYYHLRSLLPSLENVVTERSGNFPA